MKRKISKGGGERLGSITKHWNKHGFKTATVFAITQNWLLLEFCLQDILTRTWISSKEVSKYSKAFKGPPQEHGGQCSVHFMVQTGCLGIFNRTNMADGPSSSKCYKTFLEEKWISPKLRNWKKFVLMSEHGQRCENNDRLKHNYSPELFIPL